MNVKRRFEIKIRIDNDSNCWIWMAGSKDKNRKYGIFQIGNKGYRAHRVSMYLYKGFDLNSKEQINHKCNTTSCVNPDHLYIGTQSENMKDWHKKLGHIMNEKEIK